MKAYAIYLLCRQHVPQQRCAEALSEMFGVEVSVGTLNNWLDQAAGTLDVFLTSVRAGLGDAPVIHVDETPVRHGKRKAWFHVCSTRSLTLLWATGIRGRIAVDTGPLPGYTGVAVHDRYALYFQYRCEHALCNAHLIRNLAGVGMVHSQEPWTDAIIDLLTGTNTQVNTARTAGKTKLSTYHQRQITRRWDLYCEQALAANPDPPPHRTRNSYERDSHNLALALVEHRNRFLAFTTNFAIPFDNNTDIPAAIAGILVVTDTIDAAAVPERGTLVVHTAE